jgi:hypothetical protein
VNHVRRNIRFLKWGLIVKPVLLNRIPSGFDPYESQTDVEFKFILVYQNRLTKFIEQFWDALLGVGTL